MGNLVKPLQFGALTLPSNIFYAPLAGCSDYPFRQMAARYPVGLMFCEMVKMEALIQGGPSTRRLLEYHPCMRPIGAQLCGSQPNLAGPSAKIIEDLGFDVVDLNCGCPVDKVTKDGSGSGMLKHPERIGEVLSRMVAAVRIPVTIKIRTGWDDETINASQITRIAEQAGAKAITIHGRTREQKYRGKANWDYIKEAKQVAQTIKVIGNGDVFDPETALELLRQAECDGVLVARGTFGQPWIAENIYRLDANQPLLIPDVKAHLLDHMDHITSYQNDQKALLDLKRIGCWYLREIPGAKKLREALNRSKELKGIEALIKDWEWGNPSI